MGNARRESLPFFAFWASLRQSCTRRGPPHKRFGDRGGPPLNLVRGAPVLMVGTDTPRVEQHLSAGEYECPVCGGRLRPWGHARARVLGRGAEAMRVRPRRARCATCLVTHVLLPVLALLRRCDLAESIGEALALKVAGWGYRRIAAAVGIPASTVGDRGRRFVDNAEAIRVRFTALAYALDPSLGAIEPRASPLADALEAVAVAAGAAARAFGPSPLWRFAAGASQGRLLAPHQPEPSRASGPGE